MINLKLFKLVLATIESYPIIQNMARFYTYDMSKYLGWEIPIDGLYSCIDFKKYWSDKNAKSFLIYYEKELAGFIIIDKKGSIPEIDFNMAQFFILGKFQGKGVGSYIAEQCFKLFHGKWEVMVMPGNSGAYQFWEKVIAKFSHGKFTKYTGPNPHLGHDEARDMFRFNVT